MKPLSIADYLDHLGPAPVEKAPPRRESSPFRPRSLPSLAGGEPRSRPAFDAPSAERRRSSVGQRCRARTPWDRKPLRS